MKKQKKRKMVKNGTFLFFLLVILILFQLTLFGNYRILQYFSLKGSQFANIISGILVLNTNNYRIINNDNPLVISDKLTRGAQMKAEDMAKKSYFSHTGPEGELPWSWFQKIGYKYEYAGENLAVDFTESNDVSVAWINSAKHKANLLNPNFTEIGIGIAKGVYEGHDTTFVVQFFGKPYEKTTVTSEVKNPITKSTIKLLASSSPAQAVVTEIGLPPGVVLGAENTPGLTEKIWLWISSVFRGKR